MKNDKWQMENGKWVRFRKQCRHFPFAIFGPSFVILTIPSIPDLILVLLLVCPMILPAQERPARKFESAGARSGKDYDGAIKILQEFLETQGNQPRPGTWTVLATAYRFKGRLRQGASGQCESQQASPQFAQRGKAVTTPPASYALKNDKEEAFKLLRQLRESGAFDMSLIYVRRRPENPQGRSALR